MILNSAFPMSREIRAPLPAKSSPGPVPAKAIYSRPTPPLRAMRLGSVLFALLCALCGNSPAANKPNILLVLADDLRFSDLDFQHLNIALGSLGETMSGFVAYHRANQNSKADFDSLDTRIFRLENRLLRLVEALERKRDEGTWDESMTLREPAPNYAPDPDINLVLTNLAL
jgi:hypothetical protein